jgi:hypothetical protein
MSNFTKGCIIIFLLSICGFNVYYLQQLVILKKEQLIEYRRMIKTIEVYNQLSIPTTAENLK